MLRILVLLLKNQKTVTVEKLVTVFPQPIKFESRAPQHLKIFKSPTTKSLVTMISLVKTLSQS